MQKHHLRAAAVTGVVLWLAGCNDLTQPLPPIQGSYEYSASSGDFVSLNREGTLTIVDLDPRTARFEGNYQFINDNGLLASGQLIGAFMSRDRIWFRFLGEQQIVHEGDLDVGLGLGSGQLFFLGLVYENTGATFSLRRR